MTYLYPSFSDRSCYQINAVRIYVAKRPESRIVAQTGEGVYDAAGQVVKSMQYAWGYDPRERVEEVALLARCQR